MYRIELKQQQNNKPAEPNKCRRLVELFLGKPAVKNIGPIAIDFEQTLLTTTALTINSNGTRLNGENIGLIYYHERGYTKLILIVELSKKE